MSATPREDSVLTRLMSIDIVIGIFGEGTCHLLVFSCEYLESVLDKSRVT